MSKRQAYVTGGGNIPEKAMKQINQAIDSMFPTDILDTLDPSRPYNGQSWTDEGLRGKQEISGITMRDIRDCFIRACYQCDPMTKEEERTYVLTGKRTHKYPNSVYKLNWDGIDIMAVCQNMLCWIERYMGIFPNINKISDKQIKEEINKNSIEINQEDLN